MFLYARKIKGVSIAHPIGRLKNLPKIIDPVKLKELVGQLMQGDTTVIREIIYGHLRLCLVIASQYAVGHEDKSHDLVSEALLSVVETCKRFQEGNADNNETSAYFSMRIHSALARYLREDRLVCVPHTTLVTNGLKQPKISRKIDNLQTIDSNTIDLYDALEAITNTDEEKQIIQQLADGITGREIARNINASKSYVSKVRVDLAERYIRSTEE